MPVLQAITKHANKTIDVHLMIVDPDRYIKTFAELGSILLTVHYEACTIYIEHYKLLKQMA